VVPFPVGAVAPLGPLGWFPSFIATMRRSDFRPVLPLCLGLPSARRYLVASLLRSHPHATLRAWASCLFTRRPLPGPYEELVGSPRFLGGPVSHAALLDPGGSALAGHFASSPIAFCLMDGLGPATHNLSRFDRAAHVLRSLRFAASVAPVPRKTRFRPVANLSRAGFSPA